jgi:hypothetical protein
LILFLQSVIYFPDRIFKKEVRPMQVQSVILHDIGGCLPHDTGGMLLRLGHDATALASQAQALPAGDPRTKQLLGRARALRLQERLGWLAVRTSEFPAGDMEGAAKASLALGAYHLYLFELEEAREWLATALAESPKDKDFVRAIIAHNMRALRHMLRDLSSSSTPAQSGRSSPAAGGQPARPAADAAAALEKLRELLLAPAAGAQPAGAQPAAAFRG